MGFLWRDGKGEGGCVDRGLDFFCSIMFFREGREGSIMITNHFEGLIDSHFFLSILSMSVVLF